MYITQSAVPLVSDRYLCAQYYIIPHGRHATFLCKYVKIKNNGCTHRKTATPRQFFIEI